MIVGVPKDVKDDEFRVTLTSPKRASVPPGALPDTSTYARTNVTLPNVGAGEP